ncbi:MAG: hypothetical protein U5L05_13500 [Rubrivivax sp.]|nr:hypothetical protein [Rubrivivax sp.]
MRWMLRLPTGLLLAASLVATLAGCATTQITAEWRNPTFNAASLKGARVLVVCRSPDEAVRRGCEDQWSNQLGARGIVAVRSYSIPGLPWASPDTSEEMRGALRASGAAMLASMSLYAGGVAVVNPGAQVGVGVSAGSGGGHRGGGFSVGGIGISFPIGGATAAQSLAASSSLTEAAQGMLVWSGSASAPASGDALAQVGALTQVTIEAIQRAGLI